MARGPGIVNTVFLAMFAVVVGFAVYKTSANLTGGIGSTIKGRVGLGGKVF